MTCVGWTDKQTNRDMREMAREGFDSGLCWARQTNRDMREMAGEGFDSDLCWAGQRDRQRYERDGRRGL